MNLKRQRAQTGDNYTALELVTKLLMQNIANSRNPTTHEIMSCVVGSIERDEPVKIYATQQIAEVAEVRHAKLSHFAGEKNSRPHIRQFIADTPTKPSGSWIKLRSLIQQSIYPVDLTLIIDDSSLYTIHRCEEWCDAHVLERLRHEINIACDRIAARAREFFHDERVKVSRWSEHYPNSDFRRALTRALNLSHWHSQDRTGIFETCLEMHCDPWGYRELCKSKGLSSYKVDYVIVSDLIATAAQQRLRADVVRRDEAISVWSTYAGPDALWPVLLSNYDGVGYAASLIVS